MNSFPKDNDMSFISKIFTIMFGYFFMCGIADFKIKIKRKKAKRLRKIMHEINSAKYEAQFRYNDSVQNKGFLQGVFHKEPSVVEQDQEILQRAKQMANIINTTYDFEEFTNAFEKLIKDMELLKSIESCSFFTRTKPSKDLAEIKKKKQLTENILT